MAGKAKTQDADEKLESFILKNRRLILIAVAAVVAAAVIVCITLIVSDSVKKRALAAIDAAEYAYADKSEGLEESEITERYNTVREAVTPYLTGRGIAGVRANLLLAEAAFQAADYEAALGCYLAAADADKKAYTYAEAMYNAAVCAEETNNLTDAITYYNTAADAEGFLLASHAVFNAGRIEESLGDYAKASEYYQKAVDTYNGDSWAALSQSRLIALRANGTIE